MRFVILSLLALVLLAACAAPQVPLHGTLEQPKLNAPGSASRTSVQETPSRPAYTATGIVPTPSAGLVPLETPLANPTTAALVDQAKQRLSDRLGTETRWITLISLQTVTWRDESLGCPKGGQQKNYAQVLTPGYLIELEAAGSIYVFHTDRASRLVLCEQTPPVETYLPP